MANEKVQFLTPKHPVGRLVGGSVGQGRDKDADGHPYVIKTGANAGKPQIKYYIAVAIPKGAEQHWSSTEWGAKIWQVGHTAFPGIAQNPAFAWKVEDGDSQIPNTKGKKPCDRTGYKGNWILHCGTSIPIKACNADGSALIDAAQIKCGYYVQVALMCAGNGSAQKPGVYLNPQAVALQFVGEEIVQGLDIASVGFGGATAPAGASAPPNVLTGVMAPPAPGVSVPITPAAPAFVPPMAALAPPAVPGVPAPNAAILAPPAAPVAPMAPPAPPAAPVGPQMTPKAAPFTYQQLIAAGWTDATLRQNGMMV
jgi:hypothetical protein